MELPVLLLFLSASLSLNLTPGPDMVYVLSRSLSQGRMAGIACSLGVAAGCLVHTFAVAFGLATLLKAVPILYDAVRLIGAGYLIYLGLRLVTKRSVGAAAQDGSAFTSSWRLFGQGFLTNLLNPKVALFFLAFLPQFVNENGSMVAQILFLGIVFNISGTLVNIAVATCAGYVQKWIRMDGAFRWIPGSMMMGLGVYVALNRK